MVWDCRWVNRALDHLILGWNLGPFPNSKKKNPNLTKKFFVLHLYFILSVIFFPARPASQTHNSHKGRMILNHESPAVRIKNCGEKSAFSICNFRFESFLLVHRVLIILVKTGTEKLPNSSDHYFPWETRVFRYESL